MGTGYRNDALIFSAEKWLAAKEAKKREH